MIDSYFENAIWRHVKNTSGEVCPPFGLLAVTDTEMRGVTSKYPVILGAKPSTTFYAEYVVNGPTAIPAGGYGRCTRSASTIWIKYDSGTPANGEGWGPKPGQWTASKGFPGILVKGVQSTANTRLLGTLSPITTLLCKASADLSVGSVSTNFKIWSGTVAGGSDAGFTTLPAIEIGAPYKNNDFFVAHRVNNGWISGYPSKSVTVVTDEQVDGATRKLQKKTRTIYVLAADAESSWTDVHTGVECP